MLFWLDHDRKINMYKIRIPHIILLNPQNLLKFLQLSHYFSFFFFGPGFSPKSHFAFSRHGSWASFNVEQVFGPSLVFTALTIFESGIMISQDPWLHLSAHILVSKYQAPMRENYASLEKQMVAGLGQKMFKMSLKHLVVPENMKVLKKGTEHSKKIQKPTWRGIPKAKSGETERQNK